MHVCMAALLLCFSCQGFREVSAGSSGLAIQAWTLLVRAQGGQLAPWGMGWGGLADMSDQPTGSQLPQWGQPRSKYLLR